MAASPHVLINDGSGPDINPDSTGNPNYPSGANVTPGNVIHIRLASADSVGQWTLKVVGTDEETTSPSLTGVDPTTGVVSTPSTTVTFTIPSGVAGRTYIFQSMVNNGGPAYTTTFGVYTLTSGLFRVGAVGERFESDPVFGWTRTLNRFIKRGGGSGAATGLLSLTTIVDVSAATAPTAGQVLTAASDTEATWQTPSGSSATPLSSVIYVDKNTTTPLAHQNGSATAPFSTLAAGIAATPSSGTIYIVPSDYTGEGTQSPAGNLSLMGLDLGPTGSATGGDMSFGTTLLPDFVVSNSAFLELTNVIANNITTSDAFGYVAIGNSSVTGNITGGGFLVANSTVIIGSLSVGGFDFVNCDLGRSGSTFTVTRPDATGYVTGCFFLPGVTVHFTNSGGTVQLDEVSYQSWLNNNVTLTNGSAVGYAPPNVRAASLTNVNLGSTAVATAFDGVTLTSGDRVLIVRQTTSTQNGVYRYTGSGFVATGDIVTCGGEVFVQEGEIFAGRTFQQLTEGTPGSISPQVWKSELGPHLAPPLVSTNSASWVTMDTVPGPPTNGETYDLIVIVDNVATKSDGSSTQRERGPTTYSGVGGVLTLSDSTSESLTAPTYFRQVISGNTVLIQRQVPSGGTYSFRVRIWYEYVRTL